MAGQIDKVYKADSVEASLLKLSVRIAGRRYCSVNVWPPSR